MENFILHIKKTLFSIGLIIVIVSCMNCSNKKHDDHQEKAVMEKRSIEEVIEQYTQELMSISDVVGVGQGLCNDEPCINVLAIKKISEIDQKIPDSLDHYKVNIKVTGTIVVEPTEQEWEYDVDTLNGL